MMLVSACGSRGSGSGYGSVDDVAQALGCQSPGKPSDNAAQGYTELTCTFDGGSLAIFWMDDGKAMSYSGEDWATEEFWPKRDPWNIECSSRAQCVKVHHLLGDGDMFSVEP